jgi:hypothetical protein
LRTRVAVKSRSTTRSTPARLAFCADGHSAGRGSEISSGGRLFSRLVGAPVAPRPNEHGHPDDYTGVPRLRLPHDRKLWPPPPTHPGVSGARPNSRWARVTLSATSPAVGTRASRSTTGGRSVGQLSFGEQRGGRCHDLHLLALADTQFAQHGRCCWDSQFDGLSPAATRSANVAVVRTGNVFSQHAPLPGVGKTARRSWRLAAGARRRLPRQGLGNPAAAGNAFERRHP